ncbi:MAG: multimeric flavodoxin WrbA [Firmicutes bacterium]|nr:multimeric flavodoxin WrbA [Bacillota bacterium]
MQVLSSEVAKAVGMMKMKVVAFNGSPHPNGNTAQAIQVVLDAIHGFGIGTEVVQVGGKKLYGCMGCYQCRKIKNRHCVMNDDEVNGFIDKMLEADCIIFGSPVYSGNITAALKALIERSGFVAKGNDFMFRRKVGVPVVVATKAGGLFAHAAINLMFGTHQMVTIGSSYWSFVVGQEPGDIWKDEEGIKALRTLGENVAWLLSKIKEEKRR